MVMLINVRLKRGEHRTEKVMDSDFTPGWNPHPGNQGPTAWLSFHDQSVI